MLPKSETETKLLATCDLDRAHLSGSKAYRYLHSEFQIVQKLAHFETNNMYIYH